mgnify:CR=1 FL=1
MTMPMPSPEHDSAQDVAVRLRAGYDPHSSIAAQSKRFFELWLADAEFRASLEDGRALARKGEIDVDPEDLKFIWNDRYRQGHDDADISDIVAKASPALRALFSWIQYNHHYRDRMRLESTPVQPSFAAWRARQIARCATSFRAAYHHNTPHVGYALELTAGCTVGCWFCGVSAPKLDGIFAATEGNLQFFEDVLTVIGDIVGPPALGHGFLYWATDPFDHPDYELFARRFQSMSGQFPLTTTAIPLRNPARTRSFLALAQGSGAEKVRFSASTLRQVHALHAEFTAQDLAIVDIIPLNKGSLLQPSASGRARERLQNRAPVIPLSDQVVDVSRDQTISCVSGFLINLVTQSVKLISPCNSSDRWPLGYFVYEERRFSNTADLERIMAGMIERHMPEALPVDRPVAFRSDLQFKPRSGGFTLAGPHAAVDITCSALAVDVAEAVARGDATPAAIASDFAASYPLPADMALDWMRSWFDAGLVSEEPNEP